LIISVPSIITGVRICLSIVFFNSLTVRYTSVCVSQLVSWFRITKVTWSPHRVPLFEPDNTQWSCCQSLWHSTSWLCAHTWQMLMVFILIVLIGLERALHGLYLLQQSGGRGMFHQYSAGLQ
jgi:hypothetical protein